MSYGELEIIHSERIYRLSELFKALGDPTRIRILYQISQQETCVSDISSHLNISESSVSHHLQLLKMSGLVKRRRNGKSILYSLSDPSANCVLQQGLKYIVKEGKAE